MDFKIINVDDENIEFFVDGVEVGHFNYDEDGSRAIDGALEMFREMSVVLGASFEEIYQ